VIKRGKNLRFALKSRHTLGITCKGFGQMLDSYVTAKLGITGTINLTHSARTDSACDFIRAYVGAGGQGHLGLDYSPGMLTHPIT
jgi:hypothetical protein